MYYTQYPYGEHFYSAWIFLCVEMQYNFLWVQKLAELAELAT